MNDARMAIAHPVKLGYQFTYTPGTNGSAARYHVALVARPVQPGFTGTRDIFI
jgi:hypothetical protein